MKNNNINPANIELTAPKKLIVNVSRVIPGSKTRGMKLIRIVPEAIIKLEDIRPNPYNIKINTLLFGVLEIPNDQKKKIALSSQGIKVCRIPNKNAGAKINNNGGG